MSQSVHVPLADQTKHIRLLQLRAPSKRSFQDETIECDLVEIDPTDGPRYEAVSYCWGSPNRTHNILCHAKPSSSSFDSNGSSFKSTGSSSKSTSSSFKSSFSRSDSAGSRGSDVLQVTEDLYTALLELRPETGYRNLWVDQLCIQQSSMHDRRQHVRRMDKIYHHAARTIIWLGPCTSGSSSDDDYVHAEADASRAFGLVTTVADAVATWLRPKGISPVTHASLEDCEAFYNSLATSTSPAWRALDAVLDNAWFSRAWVLQEVAASNRLILRCGQHECQWDKLAYALVHYASSTGPCNLRNLRALTVALFERKRVAHLRTLATDPESQILAPLSTILADLRGQNATDARDKVYSALNLAIPSVAKRIKVDYEHSARETYIQTARALLWQGDKYPALANLVALSLAEGQEGSDLPSWVPDWRIKTDLLALNVDNDRGNRATFSACGRRNKVEYVNFFNYHGDSDGEELRIRGVLIDSIAQLYDTLRPAPTMARGFDDSDHDSARVMLSWISAAQLHLAHRPAASASKKRKRSPSVSRSPVPKELVDVLTAEGLASPPIYRTLEKYNVVEHWHKYLRSTVRPPSASTSQQNGTPPAPLYDKVHASNMQLSLLRPARNRRLASTARGRLALVPKASRVGDAVVVLCGGNVPFVLRRLDDGSGEGKWKNVGESYVHGVMRCGATADIVGEKGGEGQVEEICII